MKNLKRVLSLALSGIMLVGMMAMSASAVNAEDFTDSDEITHTEAVSISTALKIIDGQEDGSFNPNGNVTRGQMAKMITRAMFGGEDPVLGVKTEPTFTDIKGRWDESYIEYCASNGIINGRGDGTFDPEGNVTGTEAAKMLLSALGYRADIYGLTGTDWAISTNSIANRTDVALYGDLKGLDPNAAFTRDQVAQMIYNALNAETMEMKPGMEITNGNVTYNYEPSKKTLLFDRYGAVRVEGVVESNEFTNNADSQKGKTRIDISNVDEIEAMLGDLKSDNPSINAATGKDEFGKSVYFYLKPSSSVKTDLSKGSLISDVLVSETNVVITCTKSFGTDKTVTNWLDDNGLEIGGGQDEPAAPKYLKNYSSTGAPTTTSPNTAGNEFIAIDNDDDGYVDYVLENTYAFGKVTKYSTKDDGSVTVATSATGDEKALVPTNAELKDIVAYEDIAVDDYVNVTKVAGKFYITEAETVEGELEAFKTDKNVTVDGETYNFSARVAHTDLDARTAIADNNVLGEAVTLYLDNFGYFVAGSTEAATEYLFVANASWNNVASSLTSGTVDAFVYMEDGTSASYAIDKIDGTKAKSGDQKTILGGVYKYSITSSGKLNLTSPKAKDDTSLVTKAATGKKVDYKKGQSTLTVAGGTTTYVTNDTVVFLVTLDSKSVNNNVVADVTIDKVNAYTGKTAPSMSFTTDSNKQVVDTDGKFYSGLITVAADKGSTTNDVVVFIHNETDANGDWLYLIDYVKTDKNGAVWNAIVDGELVQVTTNDKGDASKKSGAYEYEMDDDLYAIGDVYGQTDSNFVKIIDDKSVVLDNSAEYKIGNDTITAQLDGKDTVIDVSVAKKDRVVVVFDNGTDKNAKGIFILDAADGTDTGILATADTVTGKGSATDPYVVPTDTNTVAGIKALFTTQKDVTKMVVETKPTDGAKVSDLQEIATNDEATKCAAGKTVYLVVIPNGAADDSTDFAVYAVKVAAAALTDATAPAVTLESGTLTVTSSPVSLTAGSEVTAEAGTYASSSADKLKIKVAGTAGTDYTNLKLKQGDGQATDYTSEGEITVAATGDLTLEITLTAKGDGSTTKDKDYTYKVKITVS